MRVGTFAMSLHFFWSNFEDSTPLVDELAVEKVLSENEECPEREYIIKLGVENLLSICLIVEHLLKQFSFYGVFLVIELKNSLFDIDYSIIY